MHCHDALEILEADSTGAWDADADLVDEAQRHLAECDQCRAAWPQRQSWGRQLATAMQEVAVPAGLQERLRAQIPQPLTATGSIRVLRSSRRVWWGAAIATAVTAALLVLALWPVPQPLKLDQLLAAADAPLDQLPPFDGRFTPQLPKEWEPYFELDPVQVRSFSPPDSPQTVGLVPFQFTLRRGTEPLQGRLLILQKNQLVEAEVPRETFVSADILYIRGGRGAWIVWSEGNWIFACLMTSERAPADLFQFRRALTTSRPLG